LREVAQRPNGQHRRSQREDDARDGSGGQQAGCGHGVRRAAGALSGEEFTEGDCGGGHLGAVGQGEPLRVAAEPAPDELAALVAPAALGQCPDNGGGQHLADRSLLGGARRQRVDPPRAAGGRSWQSMASTLSVASTPNPAPVISVRPAWSST